MQHKDFIRVKNPRHKQNIINDKSTETKLINAIKIYNEGLRFVNAIKGLIQNNRVNTAVNLMERETLQIIADSLDYGGGDYSECKTYVVANLHKLIDQIELQLKQYYLNIEILLQNGCNPNEAEVVCLSASQYDIKLKRECSHLKIRKAYPLHCVKDKNIIELLLRFGADVNLRGYALDGSGEYQKKNDDITALEAASLRIVNAVSGQVNDYYNNFISMFFHSCELNIDTIESSLQIFMNVFNKEFDSLTNPRSVKFWSMDDISSDKIKSSILIELIERLSYKSSEKYLLKTLDISLKYQTELQTLRKEYFQNRVIYQDQLIRCCELINIKIDIFKGALFRKLGLKIWLVFFSGYAEHNGDFKELPFDILKIIMVMLFRVDIYEKAIGDMKIQEFKNELLLDAFRKIQIIMIEHDVKYFDNIEAAVLHVKNCENKAIKNNEDKVMIKAWSLALDHYDDLTIKNERLVDELTKWTVKNNTVNKIALFEIVKKKLYLSIKKDIIKRIEELQAEENIKRCGLR